MPDSKEQSLINAIFEIAQISAYTYGANGFHEYLGDGGRNREAHMAWVADQLRKMGYDTRPMGMSWGVLKDE